MNNKEIRIESVKRMERIVNDGLTFILVLRGNLILDCENTEYKLSDDAIAVLNDGDYYSLTSDVANVIVLVRLPKKYITVRFPQFMQYRFDCIASSRETADDDSLRKFVARLAFLHYKNDANSELLMESVVFKILHLLVTSFSTVHEEQEKQGEDHRLKLALNYIHLHFKNRIQLGDVAKYSFISPQHLSRLFRAILNTTFLNYIKNLRVTSASNDLLNSIETVTKIAMNNGFSSDKAMSKAFVQRYGMTPHLYRKYHQEKHIDDVVNIDSVTLLSEVRDDALEALARIINDFEHTGQEQSNPTLSFPLNKNNSSNLKRLSFIVDIGNIGNCLRASTRQQLHEVSKHLQVQYVSFGGVLQVVEAALKDNTRFKLFDLFEVLSLFQQLHMIPFIQLELDDLRKDLFKPIRSILETISLRYPVGEWHLEVVGSEKALCDYFPIVSSTFRRYIPEGKVGIRVQIDREDAFQTEQLLPQLAPYQIDFLSLIADPNCEIGPNDPTDFEQFQRTYHENKIKKLRKLVEQAGLKLPIFLTDWNTLTGSTTVEAGEFHRTALIADTLCRLSPLVTGVSIRLGLDNDHFLENSMITYPLSLFIYRNIRRPMFFVIRAYTKLKTYTVAKGDGYLLTYDGIGSFALLLYNACYVNPFLALDNIRRSSHIQKVSYELTGVPLGRYRVKKYLIDKDNGSMYNVWLKMDVTIPFDEEDIDDYFENASNPSVRLYEKVSNGEILIREELAMNATALLIMKLYEEFPNG